MAFDMSRCPQTEQEARDWFYQGIGKTPGQPADGWEQIMTNCGLPPGYGPGVKPHAGMPFFAFTQQFSGGPKGRIFLPSNTPDENGYYTRCIQYLDDAVQTYSKKRNPKEQFSAKSSGLVWAWYHVAGHQYDPVQAADGSGQNPGGAGVTKEEVQAMLSEYFKVGDKVSLEASGGKLLCMEDGGPKKDNEPFKITSRSGVGPWESLKMHRGQ